MLPTAGTAPLQYEFDAVRQDGETITLRTQPAPGGTVQITVQDTGPPLAERAAVRVLEAVYARPEDSVGLRLSISRSVIEAYGGRLWAEASVDGGAAFHVTLPVTAE